MTALIHIFIPLVLVFLCAKPLGEYMARIYMGKKVWLHRYIGWIETGIYRVCAIDPKEEMHWLQYFMVVVAYGVMGFLLLFFILIFQEYLPLNPNNVPNFSPDLAFNTAISFVSHTSWQSFSGEKQVSIFAQTCGLVVQNFMSAGSGMAVAVALFRGLKRKNMNTLGNAWADIVRGVLYILLPFAVLLAVVLVSQGTVQTIGHYVEYEPLEMKKESGPHIMAVGPVASQASIKLLSSNGGGFFNTNSAHPFSNPSPVTNLLCYIMLTLLPAAFIYCYGVMIGDRKQSWSLLAAMTIIYVPLAMFAAHVEHQWHNPHFDQTMINQSAGNMEGKEVRIGAIDSALWAVGATATSGGSVNSMHDSYMPLSGMVCLMLIQFGDVIYGGMGNGVIEVIMYLLITVFLAGLMVGRTPEYLGKKLGPYEIKLIGLVMIIPAILVLGGTAIAVNTPQGQMAVHNAGAQGFSEILYTFSSVSRNNGSAFAGINSNTPFYNIILGICMLVGRYWVFAPVLAIAGSFAAKQTIPGNSGTLPTHTPLFTLMLVAVILLVDVLTYAPSLALGPVAEHISLFSHVVPAP